MMDAEDAVKGFLLIVCAYVFARIAAFVWLALTTT